MKTPRVPDLFNTVDFFRNQNELENPKEGKIYINMPILPILNT